MTTESAPSSRIANQTGKSRNVIFADLTHAGHSCNAVPYGAALVAAYALEYIGRAIAVRLVKSPTELICHLEQTPPDMACFSTYIWNTEISRAFARRIKEQYPSCVTVFGGPNYPISGAEQEALLRSHPEIDFVVYREGEVAFVNLYRALAFYSFNAEALRADGVFLPGCHYVYNGVFYAGAPPVLIDPLDDVPSPYLTGLCDQFLEEGYAPIIQTTRGCPFHCSFCQEGSEQFNPIRRYSVERIKQELWYLCKRKINKTLHVADSNCGMYQEDITIARELSAIQRSHNWPTYFVGIGAKNNKKRALEAASLIKGAMLSAAVQSSDPQVLKNIRRQNVSLSEMIQMVVEQDGGETHSFSEVILCLPGDTKLAHIKTLCELMDTGIHVVRSHQLIMLPGSEISSSASRAHFGLKTRFRLMHATAEPISFFGDTFTAPEVDEICVASATMSFQSYLECRLFDLTVEIFYNNGIFAELNSFLKLHRIAISDFICCLHERVLEQPVLKKLYDGFLVDNGELWESREELMLFFMAPGVSERYSNGELGRNEQLAYTAQAILEHMDVLIEHAHHVAGDMLRDAGVLSQAARNYLDELRRFDLLRKQEPLTGEGLLKGTFSYDFVALSKKGFKGFPEECKLCGDIVLAFQYTPAHQEFVRRIGHLLKSGLSGYTSIISANPKVNEYFRVFYAE